MADTSPKTGEFLAVQARHVRQCLREARCVGVIWLAAFAYCSTALSTLGYVPPERRPDVPDLLWGIPSWVVWGLFVPWIVLIVVTWLFAALVLKDDEPYMDFPKGNADDAAPSD